MYLALRALCKAKRLILEDCVVMDTLAEDVRITRASHRRLLEPFEIRFCLQGLLCAMMKVATLSQRNCISQIDLEAVARQRLPYSGRRSAHALREHVVSLRSGYQYATGSAKEGALRTS